MPDTTPEKLIDREAIETALDTIAPGSQELKDRACSILNIGEDQCTPAKIEETLKAAGAHELARRLMEILPKE